MPATVDTPVPDPPAPGGTEATRLDVLDILRGIALLGMMVVHFTNRATDPEALSAAASAYWFASQHFLQERFWAMFAILFGAGFALQLLRFESRGEPFLRRYVRRLLVLFAFGFIAEAGFGYNVLMAYAVWGLGLLLVRKWSVRALAVAIVLCASSWTLYNIAHAAIAVRAAGEAAYRAEHAAVAESNVAHREAHSAAQLSPSYLEVVRARLRNMPWFYSQPFSMLPVNTFALLLMGLLAFRIGLFSRPEEHRRLIVALMIFGALASLATNFLPGASLQQVGSPLPEQLALAYAQQGLGLIRGMWLTFTYMGAVLLLASYRSPLLRVLRPFAWTGRIALTAYLFHIALLDLLLSPYGLGIGASTLPLLGASIMCFAALALAARGWLANFRLGPLEWVWRSATYGRIEPMRRSPPAVAVPAL